MNRGWWRDSRDLWVELAFWIAIATAAFILTFDFDGPLQIYKFGAAAWPRAIIAALALGAAVQFAFSVRLRARIGTGEARQDYWSKLAKGGLSVKLRIAATFGLPLLYIFLLPRTGFYLTTPFFLAGYMFVLGERRAAYLIGVPALIYGLAMLIFTRLLFVALPVETWPGFYDFSNWLLVLVR